MRTGTVFMCPFLFAENYISRELLSLLKRVNGNKFERLDNMYIEAEEYNKNVQLKIGQRIENELSEPDMAAYLDITANSYSRIERGEVKCDLPKLFIICQMLDISADYILFGKAKNNDGLTQEQRESIRIMKKRLNKKV